MLTTYASIRKKLPSSSFSVETITGSTTSAIAGNYNFYLSAENRSGLNQLSDPQALTVALGDGVAFTINSSAIASGETPFWLIISLETTGNASDAVRVAAFKVYDDTQVNQNSLPVTIYLTTDEHFNLARTAANFEALPSTGVLDGTIAQTIDDGNYWRYDSTSYNSAIGYRSYGAIVEGLNNWVRYHGTFSSYVADTQLFSDRVLSTVENALEIPPKIGDADSTAIAYWLNNGFESDGESPIINGCFTFTIAINEIDYTSLFSQKIKYKLLGYVDRSTGVLNTDINTVGDTLTWSLTSLGKLPADLPRNHAAMYEVYLSYTVDELYGLLPSGKPSLKLNILPVGQNQGTLSQIANYQGDLVYSDRGKLLIVPGEKRLSGIATVEMPGDYGYIINTDRVQPITGLIANTPNQVAAMAGVLNGFIRIAQANEVLNESEKVRAYISTESGISKLVSNGSAVTISNTGIEIVVTHPVNNNNKGIVRSDYPDRFIRGNEEGNFTPSEGYVILNIDGTIYQSPIETVGAQQTQAFNYSDLTGWVTLGSLPSQTDAEFSLFEPVNLTVANNGTGTINGQVQAYFGYNYPVTNTKATKIRHDIDDAMPTLTQPIGKFVSQVEQAVEHISRIDNPHAINPSQIGAATQADLDTANVAIANNSSSIASNTTNINNNAAAIALNTAARQALGTAANKNFGTATGELVELVDVNGNPGLPAIDGSQLTGVDALSEIVFVSSSFTSVVSLPPKHYVVNSSTMSDTTLPTAPADTSRISYSDRNNNFGTNNCTITAGSGDTITGQSTLLLDFDSEAVTLVYDSANTNWVVIDGIQSVSTSGSDMLKSIYDTNNNGIVDSAEEIDGIATAGSLKLYGTDGTGNPGLFDIGILVKEALEALIDPNKLLGNAISNFADISNTPGDGFAPIYDLVSSTIQWSYVNRGIGLGAILLPLAQSLFKATDGTTATAYSPEVGTATYTDIKILTTAAVADNQIQSEQLNINTTNTGVVLDLGINNTVFRTNWIFNTGDNLAIICRYESDGNMVIIDFSQTAIAVKTIVADTITTIDTVGYSFINGTNYKLDVHIIGVQYKVLVDDTVAIAESLVDDFLTATSFGIGKLN